MVLWETQSHTITVSPGSRTRPWFNGSGWLCDGQQQQQQQQHAARAIFHLGMASGTLHPGARSTVSAMPYHPRPPLIAPRSPSAVYQRLLSLGSNSNPLDSMAGERCLSEFNRAVEQRRVISASLNMIATSPLPGVPRDTPQARPWTCRNDVVVDAWWSEKLHCFA
ncbi:hypothetical protein LY76DRAFT_179643 [Colletotrichum caudatum]|nr:hypothetical protein LY76DRAFT_179643 [Colletotrichum caudatum]